MKKRYWFLSMIILLLVVYFAGPKPKTPVYDNTVPLITAQLPQLDDYVKRMEAGQPIKPDNEARIVWADSSKKQQTEYAVVYLHGFTASQGEGDPVHRDFAKKYGCNLYLSRLAGHGLTNKDAMLAFTPENLWASAVKAYAIGKKLGKKVIIMGTSTGSTLAIRLAATYPDIYSIIIYSPNIKINNGLAWMMDQPWGLQIVRLNMGGDYTTLKIDSIAKANQYWYMQYRIEALPQLQEFMDTSNLPQIYAKVKQPVLMLYYYKDEQHQDQTVHVDAMLDMFSKLGTPNALKRKAAIPNAGIHVIASGLESKDVPSVERETDKFASEVLGMK